MKKIKLYCMVGLLTIALLAGCNGKKNTTSNTNRPTDSTSTNEPTTVEPEYATGSQLSDTEALNEISANLLEEGYKLIYAGMKGDSEVLGVLRNEEANELLFKTYDVYKGKTTKKVKEEFHDALGKDVYVAKYLNETLFVKDKSNNIYYVFDKKFDLSATVELGEDAMYDMVAPDCSRIFYVERLTNKVYSFNIEAMTKSLIYEFESNEQILSGVGITEDMNHIVYKYINTTSTYTGYADIQIEEHSASMNEDVGYVLSVANNEYVYYGLNKNNNQISFYSLDRPREINVFTIDDEKEINTISYIPQTEYFCTFIEGVKNDKLEVSCKLYDRIQGVLVEKTTLIHTTIPHGTPSSVKPFDINREVSISPNTELICIYEAYDSEIKVFVWNMQIPSGTIEENVPLEF